MLPMWQRRPSGVIGLKRLDALSNYYTCLYQPILSADKPAAQAGLAAIVAHLIAVRSSWSAIDLKPLPADAWYLDHLMAAFAAHRMRPQRYVAFSNWYLPAAGLDFESYFASRRKKMRSTVRSKTNQLASKFAVEIRIIDQPEDVESGHEHYVRVYNSSWKVPEPYPDFTPGLMRYLAARGFLRLGLLFLDVDRVQVVDFLSGDDEYKAQWMSHKRERIGIEIINARSLSGLAVMARRRVGAIKRQLTSPAP